ncbi:hypothetical protein Hanom_Chr10g00939881 [Helianthus anomalus]
MSPWQFIMIVAASSFGEELFYRAATGVLPPYVLFAQAFAAVITAALTGSLYYCNFMLSVYVKKVED